MSEWKFREIFNTEFNLSFARLKVDTCGTCDKINAEKKSVGTCLIRLKDIEDKRQHHLGIVEKIKIDNENQLEACCGSANRTVFFTFDLQRALEMPIISTGEAYYKRQLWFYNLCIYDDVKRIGYMYV